MKGMYYDNKQRMKNVIFDEQVHYYKKNDMQREIIIQRLHEKGCRLTKQRQVLLDIILEQDCTNCKEMYYKASAMDVSIGMATVYRMVSVLEEIGVFSRKNIYKISCDKECNKENACVIEFTDNTCCHLSVKAWHEVLAEGLRACGYAEGKRISRIEVKGCSIEWDK